MTIEQNHLEVDYTSLSDEEFLELAERTGEEFRKEFHRRETTGARSKIDPTPYLDALSPRDAIEARTLINAISNYVTLHGRGEPLDPARYPPVDADARPAVEMLGDLLLALSPRSTPEARTISDALSAYMNTCDEHRARDEHVDHDGWRAAGAMVKRGFETLAAITGQHVIETSSPERARGIMMGFDPGEPPPPKKAQA